jgi:hypothetical protein
MAKRPIDLKRESAFSGAIGTADDGAIQEFLNVGNSLLMIQDRAIYKFQLADQIDPDRTNINVPHTQQKIYSVGSSSEIVGRILLTAKYLFQNGMLDGRFDKAALMSATLDYFDEAQQLVTLSDSLIADQNIALGEVENQRAHGSVVSLPSISDLGGKVNSFIQHAEHSMQRVLSLSRIFYPLPAGKAWFDSLVKAASEAHRLEQPQAERLGKMVKFAQFLRNCRNCVEHPKHHQRVVVTNFEMTANAEIRVPLMEIVHEQTPEPVVPVTIFMENMTRSVVAVGEEMMAFLASYHVTPDWEGKVFVWHFPEGQRRHPHVRYYFALNMNGQIVPIG